MMKANKSLQQNISFHNANNSSNNNFNRRYTVEKTILQFIIPLLYCGNSITWFVIFININIKNNWNCNGIFSLFWITLVCAFSDLLILILCIAHYIKPHIKGIISIIQWLTFFSYIFILGGIAISGITHSNKSCLSNNTILLAYMITSIVIIGAVFLALVIVFCNWDGTRIVRGYVKILLSPVFNEYMNPIKDINIIESEAI